MSAVLHQRFPIDDGVVNAYGALRETRCAFGKIVDSFRCRQVDGCGSKTKTSAAKPRRKKPRSWKPNTDAGMNVIFLIASSSVMKPRWRTQ